MDQTIYTNYLEILREELVPAMGCTEPIAIAYCAAKAREALGTVPDRLDSVVHKHSPIVMTWSPGGLTGRPECVFLIIQYALAGVNAGRGALRKVIPR